MSVEAAKRRWRERAVRRAAVMEAAMSDPVVDRGSAPTAHEDGQRQRREPPPG